MAELLNKRVQFVGDSTAKNDAFVGAPRQVTVDTTRNELRLHDGRTKGGWRFPNLVQMRRLFLSRDSELGQLSFADEQAGILTRISKGVYRLRTLAGLNGVRITNEAGSAGNLTVDMPLTFEQSLGPIVDANEADKTGFYIVSKGPTANTPAEWLTNSDVAIEVFNYEDSVGGTVLQVARNAQAGNPKVYYRLRVGGDWADWQTREDYETGDYESVYNGSDETPKLWSAHDLTTIIRQMLQSIQYINDTNAAVAKSFNELFAIKGVGTQTSKFIPGTFNMATNDRFELIAGATAANLPGGDTQYATIEIEKSDLSWDVVANVAVTSPANQGPTSIETRYRFVKTAGGYQPVDDSWANLGAAVTATLTGRFRVSVGALNEKGARGARWR